MCLDTLHANDRTERQRSEIIKTHKYQESILNEKAGRLFDPVSLLDGKEQIRQDLIRRGRAMFPKLWEAQGRKCAKCGKKLPLHKACKSAYSFRIVCPKCHIGNGKRTMIIIDEYVAVPSDNVSTTKAS